MQLYIEIILLPVRKKLYLVKNDQELTVSSRYMVSAYHIVTCMYHIVTCTYYIAEPEFAHPSLFTRKYYDDSLYWLLWEKKTDVG